MAELHLVRHAPPAVDYRVPASRWELGTGAAEAVADLAASGVLPDGARWFSSPEPKALATARLLTTTAVTVYDALGEVRRPAGEVPDYAAHVRQGFASPGESALHGWETYASARERIARGVRKLLAGLTEPVVVVGHGTALTLLVAELTGAAPDLAAWERMTLPDHCTLAGDDVVELTSGWGTWRG